LVSVFNFVPVDILSSKEASLLGVAGSGARDSAGACASSKVGDSSGMDTEESARGPEPLGEDELGDGRAGGFACRAAGGSEAGAAVSDLLADGLPNGELRNP
jgi:hypothetical protein